MVELRRLDALLEPTKDAVEEEYNYQTKGGVKYEDGLKEATGQNFYNTSKWTLSRLKSQATGDKEVLLTDFIEYLNNVHEVLKSFDFYNKADAAFNRIVDTVMRRMRRSDDSLYREYNQNEGFQANFCNLLRQIIDDQEFREVADNTAMDQS